MLSDSATFRGERQVPMPRRKIVRAPDGSLVGAAGYTGDIDMLHTWVAAGMDFNNHPKLCYDHKEDDALDWLWLKPDRTLFRAVGHWSPYQVSNPTTVGMQVACLLFEGALEAGATPIRAMEIAIKGCVFTGGDVDFEHLPKPKPDNAGRLCCMPRR